MDGMRKWWMVLILGGVMLAGLVIMLAFNQGGEGAFKGWCAAVAGLGTAYTAGNVVTKFAPTEKKKK